MVYMVFGFELDNYFRSPINNCTTNNWLLLARFFTLSTLQDSFLLEKEKITGFYQKSIWSYRHALIFSYSKRKKKKRL